MTAPRIVVIDDWFPRLDTGFRVAEFGWLLKSGVAESVLTSAGPLEDLLERYREIEPDLVEHVRDYQTDELNGIDLAYILFLNNVIRVLPDLERAGVPFVCVLYPGGGLNFDDASALENLQTVLSSPQLCGVITTQPLVTKHVERLAPTITVTEIPGVVVSVDYFRGGAALREDYPADRTGQIILGFIAHRYSHDGREKGFPQFLQIVRLLRERGLAVMAHVIGGFDGALVAELGYSDIVEYLELHAALTGLELREALGRMHMVVSPNRRGVTASGLFDGFPTASVIEASLCGAAMVVSDELQQNTLFHNGFDIIIERPDPLAMTRRIEDVLENSGELRRIALAGLRQARRVYGVNVQLQRRRQIILAAAHEAHLSLMN